jgi:hypothetical protein
MIACREVSTCHAVTMPWSTSSTKATGMRSQNASSRVLALPSVSVLTTFGTTAAPSLRGATASPPAPFSAKDGRSFVVAPRPGPPDLECLVKLASDNSCMHQAWRQVPYERAIVRDKVAEPRWRT